MRNYFFPHIYRETPEFRRGGFNIRPLSTQLGHNFRKGRVSVPNREEIFGNNYLQRKPLFSSDKPLKTGIFVYQETLFGAGQATRSLHFYGNSRNINNSEFVRKPVPYSNFVVCIGRIWNPPLRFSLQTNGI